MKSVLNLYKPVGMTPLQVIEKYKGLHKEYRGKKMSYPGRLDPMAEGVLLVLVGEENKKMKQYMGLEKEYRAEILFGLSSDSHDVLGIGEKGFGKGVDIRELKKRLKGLKGVYFQKIPEFSSYKIRGKPMFAYARKGEGVEEIRKSVKINKIVVNKVYEISGSRLLKVILGKIKKVKGDFRQDKIVKKWKALLEGLDEKFYVIDVVIGCSSGTYIRAIADDIGSLYGGGLLLSLKRLRVGRFGVGESERIFKKRK